MIKNIVEYLLNMWYPISRKGEDIKMPETVIRNFYEQVSGKAEVKTPLVSLLFEKISIFFASYYYYHKIKNIAKKQDYRPFITKDKNICNGKNIIIGTRIEPITILRYSMKNGSSIKNIKENYPSLNNETIKMALLFAIKTTPFRKI